MDTAIIDRINERVGENDVLFVLGDITFRATKGMKEYRSRIHCRNIYLVFGNHDPRKKSGPYGIPDPDNSLNGLFTRIDKAMTIKVMLNGEPQYIYLHHYACRVWDKSFHSSWHLYGHSHNQLPDDPKAFSMDVGVDTHNFYPWSLLEIEERMIWKACNTSIEIAQQKLERGER